MSKKVELFVSDKCPHCKPFIEDKEANPEKYEGIDFVNINESMPNLKRFLKYRDTLSAYDIVKESGSVGVPSKVTDESEVEFVKFEGDKSESNVCEINFDR